MTGIFWLPVVPIAVALAPVGFATRGTYDYIHSNHGKIYMPAGKTRQEVQSYITVMSVKGYKQFVHHCENGDELLRTDDGDVRIYACFRGDVTVEYPK